jgi:RNA polymerase sigma factor (sigma-70 family)
MFPVPDNAPSDASTPPLSATAGASAALESVLANFGTMVRRVGWRHRLADADVDEMMQEVRIRLWRAHTEGEQIAQVSASYVYRTAVSAALDIMRRRRARRAEFTTSIDDDEGGGQEVRETAPGPMEQLEGSELVQRVMRAIETIPESRRPVVKMHLQGYHREEIAELLGWTEAKTRNLLYRGLADLRARLVEEGIEWETGE